MKKIYWDLETEGLPVSEIDKVMPEFDAPGNIKDPDKIKAAIDAKKQEFRDKAALKAITGKIIAFTFAADNDAPQMVTGSEADLIGLIVQALEDVTESRAHAYAWNGHGFDLPFLCQRGAVHGYRLFGLFCNNVRGRYYWDQGFIDPKAVWSSYSLDHTGSSLKTVARVLGVGEKTGSGADFAGLLRTNPEQAKEYALADVTLLRGVVQRMGI